MKIDFKVILFGAVFISLCFLVFSISGIGQAQNEYVGTDNCGTCHLQQKKAYDLHGHSKAAGGVKDEEGIGCESCHGPGQAHVGIGPKKLEKLEKGKDDFKILSKNDNKNMEMCKGCHTRTDNDNIILAADDLIVDLQEYSELVRSRKAKFKVTCTMCHDQHISTKEKSGIKRKCLVCHTGKFKVEVKIKAMAGLSCEDCHMPYAVRKNSDTMVKDYHKGDIRSHIFGISVDPNYTLNDGTKHASLAKDGLARLTVEMTCFSCHKAGISHDMSREEMLEMAKKIH